MHTGVWRRGRIVMEEGLGLRLVVKPFERTASSSIDRWRRFEGWKKQGFIRR
jgi:hypothetical protein